MAADAAEAERVLQVAGGAGGVQRAALEQRAQPGRLRPQPGVAARLATAGCSGVRLAREALELERRERAEGAEQPLGVG